MSKLLTKTTLLKLLIEKKLGSKYNIYTEIKPEGYTSPYILAIGDYKGIDPTTEQKVKTDIIFICEMGIDYSCDDNGDTIREELAIDLEKILSLSGILANDYYIWDGNNQGGNTKYCEFKIKL